MTRTARTVLDDCRISLDLLENEEDLIRWRVHWVGAVSLIRAVGHVLTKVDGKNIELRKSIDAAYKRWKENRQLNEIFWEFIDQERNNILKEYLFNLHPLEEVDVVVMLSLQNVATGELKQEPHVIPIGDNIYRPVLDGYREGDDARDVYRDAIKWWERELTALEDNKL